MLSVLSGRPTPLRSSVRRNVMSGEHALKPSWIAWMRDYATAARRFVAEDPIEVASEEERELVAIRAALYARGRLRLVCPFRLASSRCSTDA